MTICYHVKISLYLQQKQEFRTPLQLKVPFGAGGVSAVHEAVIIVSMPAACVTALETQFRTSDRSIDITSRLTSPVLGRFRLTTWRFAIVCRALHPSTSATYFRRFVIPFLILRNSCTTCLNLTRNGKRGEEAMLVRRFHATPKILKEFL